MKVYSPVELNAMTPDERKAALTSDFGRSFHVTASRHVTWIFWAQDTSEPTNILNHASAFMLDRGRGPMLITAAHVCRQYLADWDQFGPLYCQVANVVVSDLRKHLIACGNLGVRHGEPELDPDIATFRLPAGAHPRIGKEPVLAPPDIWPPPPNPGESVMFAGFPGQERITLDDGSMSFGFHSGMSGVTSVTEHQITQRYEREFLIDHHGHGLPPKGYGLGGISGGPLLVPLYRGGAWIWRLGGVISQATEERPPDEVIFEMVVAHRAEYIQPDGTLSKML